MRYNKTIDCTYSRTKTIIQVEQDDELENFETVTCSGCNTRIRVYVASRKMIEQNELFYKQLYMGATVLAMILLFISQLGAFLILSFGLGMLVYSIISTPLHIDDEIHMEYNGWIHPIVKLYINTLDYVSN